MARDFRARVPDAAAGSASHRHTAVALLAVSAAVASTGLAAGGTAGALLGDQIAGSGASGLPPGALIAGYAVGAMFISRQAGRGRRRGPGPGDRHGLLRHGRRRRAQFPAARAERSARVNGRAAPADRPVPDRVHGVRHIGAAARSRVIAFDALGGPGLIVALTAFPVYALCCAALAAAIIGAVAAGARERTAKEWQ